MLAPQRKGDPVAFKRDECVRPDASFEALAKLPAVIRKGGTVAAGNSSPINDGASAFQLASAEVVQAVGLMPLARAVATAAAGVEPNLMGDGPIPAVRKLLPRAGLRVPNVDLFELNEAFAAPGLGLHARPRPGSCAGERAGRSDRARPPDRIVRRADRVVPRPCDGRAEARVGIASLRIGVGQGIATLFERA